MKTETQPAKDVRATLPACGPDCRTSKCPASVAEQSGRWYVTMGHRNFNSTANNRNGYATERLARAAAEAF